MLYYIMRWLLISININKLVQVKICFSTLYKTLPLTRDPDHWEEPDKFKPERFLDPEGRLVRHERFLPFGVGTDPHMKLQVWSFWNQGSDIALGSPLPEMNSSWFSLGSYRQTFLCPTFSNKILWILWISYHHTFETLTIISLNLSPCAFNEERFSCSPSLLVLAWLNRHPTLLPASFSHQSKITHFLMSQYWPTPHLRNLCISINSLLYQSEKLSGFIHSSELFQAILRSSYTKKLVGS